MVRGGRVPDKAATLDPRAVSRDWRVGLASLSEADRQSFDFQQHAK